MHAPSKPPVRSAHRALWVACVLLAGLTTSGCSIFLPRASQHESWRIALPTDVTAALVAGALRTELQAEPVATACGAPVILIATQSARSFDIVFERNARGHWLPVANHRLRICAERGAAIVRSAALPDGSTKALRGFGSRAHGRVEVEVRRHGSASIAAVAQTTSPTVTTTISLRAAPLELARLRPVLERALRLATSLDDGGPGLAEPNLATWRLTHLLAAARTTDDGPTRGNLLRRAARQPNAPSGVYAQLAELARTEGRNEEAAQYSQCALLVEPNPCRRSELQRLLAGSASQPDHLREEAINNLLAGQTALAERVLHTARRAVADPTADYELLGYVHRQRGDNMAALAAELLAREHDAATTRDPSAAAADANGLLSGSGNLGNALPTRVLPLRASSNLYGARRVAATPPR